MSVWTKLFGKRQPPPPDRAVQTQDAGSDDATPSCLFCGSRETPAGYIGPHGYQVWTCPCGAVGSGAWAPDLDDVADQLLNVLGIDATVSEPRIATGHAGISLQRYDADKAERDLHGVLQTRGYELRTATMDTQGMAIKMFWVKR